MKFFKFIFSILLICTIIIVSLEYMYRKYSTEAQRVFVPYYNKAATVQTVLIGNSHIGAFTAVFPQDLKTIGNLSLGGQDIYRMWAALKTIVPKSPQLKKIYMGLDYDLIGYNQTKSGQEYIDRQYFSFTGELYNNTMTNRVLSRSNFFRSNRDIAYLFKKQEPPKELNFIPVANKSAVENNSATAVAPNQADTVKIENTPHKKHDPFMCRKRAEEHSLLKFKQKNISENLNFLNRIVELCNEYHIQLVLFDPPKTECYRSFCNKENIAQAKHIIDSFSVVKNIPYLDYYNDTAFNDDLFVDYDHLNKEGVLILSKKLAIGE